MQALHGSSAGTNGLNRSAVGYNFGTSEPIASTLYGAPGCARFTNRIGEDHPFSAQRISARRPARMPTYAEVMWLAGLLEGEGSFTSGHVAIPQKHREILDRVQHLFGGTVGGPYMIPSVNGRIPMFRWFASGPRGRSIARTVYYFMSTRRQAQIRKLLDVSRLSEVLLELSPHDPTFYLTDWDAPDLP